VAEVKRLHPWAFHNRDFKVLNVGALAVNWDNAAFFDHPEMVVGVDVLAGPGVQIVNKVHLLEHDPFLVTICTSMLEHDADWKASIRRMVQLTQSKGLWLITCAGPGYAEHFTKAHPSKMRDGTLRYLDHYRNISAEELGEQIGLAGFPDHELRYAKANHDTFFWGVKC
jgi:hypothetical protein